MKVKIRRHVGKAGEMFILNNNDVSLARAEYMQRYHRLLDAASEHAEEHEIIFLANRYDASNDKERDKATRLAIRILTRAIN